MGGGTLTTSYVFGGTVMGGAGATAGGLLGGLSVRITISACYVFNNTATTGSGGSAGSLVGSQGMTGSLTSTVVACYAGGKDYTNLRGTGSGTITNSYHQLATGNTEDATSKLEATLKAPTAYGSTGIYADWNVDLDNADTDDNFTTGGDDPWDFGSSTQYPVLKIDFNNDGSTADDITEQRRQQRN